jgi:hypothetical protein
MLDAKGVREFIFGSGPASYLANRTLDVLAAFIPKADIEKQDFLLRLYSKLFNLFIGNILEFCLIYTKALSRNHIFQGPGAYIFCHLQISCL